MANLRPHISQALHKCFECEFEPSMTIILYLFQGKVTDNLTEVKQARSQEKLIVSEHWLEACLESNSKVQEDFYPSTFNPKMSLSVVSKGKKSTRASVIFM